MHIISSSRNNFKQSNLQSTNWSKVLTISQKPLNVDINEESFSKSLAEVFSDPVRVNILLQIFSLGETSQQALQPLIGISRSTLSHHLRILVENGLLAVRVNPTGRPIKHYSLKKTYLKIGLDRKKLLASSNEEGSLQIYRLLESIAVQHQLLARNSLTSLEFIKKSMPFSGINLDEENNVSFQFNDHKICSPMFAMLKMGDEGTRYFGKRVLELVRECQERFCTEDGQFNLSKPDETEYFVHLGSFPFFHQKPSE